MFRAATYRPSADGLPPRSALSPRQRMVVDASAIGDLALRTWSRRCSPARVAPAVVGQFAARYQIWLERSDLGFYAELAAAQDRSSRSRTHRTSPGVVAASQSARGAARTRQVDNIAFASSFTAINPAMRSDGARASPTTLCAHNTGAMTDGPRPTLCVIHGFMALSYLVNGRFFTLPWLLRFGYDVLMYTVAVSWPAG